MSKQQKRILAAMALVMILVLGGIIFVIRINESNRNVADFQAQIDSLQYQNDLKLTNIAVNH